MSGRWHKTDSILPQLVAREHQEMRLSDSSVELDGEGGGPPVEEGAGVYPSQALDREQVEEMMGADGFDGRFLVDPKRLRTLGYRADEGVALYGESTESGIPTGAIEGMRADAAKAKAMLEEATPFLHDAQDGEDAPAKATGAGATAAASAPWWQSAREAPPAGGGGQSIQTHWMMPFLRALAGKINRPVEFVLDGDFTRWLKSGRESKELAQSIEQRDELRRLVDAAARAVRSDIEVAEGHMRMLGVSRRGEERADIEGTVKEARRLVGNFRHLAAEAGGGGGFSRLWAHNYNIMMQRFFAMNYKGSMAIDRIDKSITAPILAEFWSAFSSLDGPVALIFQDDSLEAARVANPPAEIYEWLLRLPAQPPSTVMRIAMWWLLSVSPFGVSVFESTNPSVDDLARDWKSRSEAERARAFLSSRKWMQIFAPNAAETTQIPNLKTAPVDGNYAFYDQFNSRTVLTDMMQFNDMNKLNADAITDDPERRRILMQIYALLPFQFFYEIERDLSILPLEERNFYLEFAEILSTPLVIGPASTPVQKMFRRFRDAATKIERDFQKAERDSKKQMAALENAAKELIEASETTIPKYSMNAGLDYLRGEDARVRFTIRDESALNYPNLRRLDVWLRAFDEETHAVIRSMEGWRDSVQEHQRILGEAMTALRQTERLIEGQRSDLTRFLDEKMQLPAELPLQPWAEAAIEAALAIVMRAPQWAALAPSHVPKLMLSHAGNLLLTSSMTIPPMAGLAAAEHRIATRMGSTQYTQANTLREARAAQAAMLKTLAVMYPKGNQVLRY